jgi:Gluconate 2-dehydrogenase subunit 3
MAATVTAKAAMGQEAAPVKPPTPATTTPPPGPVPWTRGLSAAKPLPMTPLVPDAIAETNTQYFSDQQMATLRRLGELFMPASKGYPGAAEAGATEFLDFLIGVSPPDRQQVYTSGMDRLEAEAKQKFGVSFAMLKADQADQLIRPWLRAWISERPPTDPYEHFINVVHSDIRTATINSQAWSDAAIAKGLHTPEVGLYWYPIDPDLRRDETTSKTKPASKRRLT